MNKQVFKNILPTAFALSVVLIMTGAAELFGQREIIFPEITAVAIGALIAPKMTWNTSRSRLFFFINIAAVIGITISRFLTVTQAVRIPVAFLTAQALLIISRTGFVPMISACVLPVVLGSESFVYVFSVFVMTGLILVLQIALEKHGIIEKREFIPAKIDPSTLVMYGKHLLVITGASAIADFSGQMYFIVPPLIVGYVEMSFPSSPLRSRYKQAIFLIFAAGIIGVVCRLGLTESLGFPLAVSAVISALGVIVIVKKIRLYFPPCGAICTLPMLLGTQNLLVYPLETTIGFIILTVISLNFFKEKGRV